MSIPWQKLLEITVESLYVCMYVCMYVCSIVNLFKLMIVLVRLSAIDDGYNELG